MALRIDNPQAENLAKELANRTGESVAQAVITALRERLERETRGQQPSLAEELVRIGQECAALPVLDGRMPEGIFGYDENGLPT